MTARIQSSGNPFEDKARALKIQRISLILWEAGARTAGDVRALGPDGRMLALGVLEAGLRGPDGPGGGVAAPRGPVTASERTWSGVASLVGYLGGGSGGRRRVRLLQPLAGLGSTKCG
jgi:hypothetical protein